MPREARGCYSRAQIENWMGERPQFYEALITRGRMTVYLRNGIVVGFLGGEPIEIVYMEL